MKSDFFIISIDLGLEEAVFGVKTILFIPDKFFEC